MHKQHNGFSLMESLVTVLVLSVGLLGLAQLQARLWTGAGDLHMLENAYLAGENLLVIHVFPWLSAADRGATERQFEDAIRITFNRFDSGRDNPALVTTEVNLNWRRPGGEHTLRLSSTKNTRLTPADARWLLP